MEIGSGDIVWLIVTVAVAAGSFFARDWFKKSDDTDGALWSQVNELKKDISELKILVAGDYVKRRELEQMESRFIGAIDGMRQDLREMIGPLASLASRVIHRPGDGQG